MRYLKQRELFLKELNTGLVKYTEDDIKSINEVLQNDIAWGDSLLGRLINSIIRKAKIGVDLVRMESVSKSIYSLFDSLISDSVISDMENPSKIKLIRFAMIMMVADLEKSAADEGDMVLNSDVEMAENVDEIKKITDRIISGGEKDIDRIIEKSRGELTEEEISLLVKDKEKLMGALKSFRESLNEIEPDEKSEKDKSEEVKKSSSDNTSIMIKNFTSLYKMLFYYNEMKSSKVRPEVKKKEDIGEKDLKDTQKVKQPVQKQVVESVNEQVSPDLDRVMKPIHEYFKQYFQFPKDEDGRKREFYALIGNEQNKAPLLKIYSIIKKKSGIKESLVELLTKPEAIADKIYTLYQVTKTKESGDFVGVDSLMKSEISTFNSTMSEILKVEKKEVVDNVETDKKEDKSVKSESRLHRYDQFINEEVEDKTGWYSKVNEFWRNVFLNKFDTLEKYNLTQDQIDELSRKAESISKNSKFVKISGQDPIIEIVRLFNRAYRIHTVEVIPSGRSDGRVSNKTFREYQYVGSGSGNARPSAAGTVEPGIGPYRNVALFSKWENAVLDILSSSKYRVIFDKDTTIKVGDSEPKKGFGPKLKNFINDMLYGNKQEYGTNQHDFVNKYFELGGDDIKHDQLEMPNTGDSEANAKTADKVNTPILEFKDVDLVDVKIGQVIRIIYRDEKNNERSTYGYVYSDKPGKFYMKLGRNTNFFRKYLPSNVKIKNKLNQMSEDIFLVKLRDGNLKKGGDYTFTDSLNISKYTKDKTIEKKTIRINPTKISILRDGDSDYIIDKPRGFDNKDSSNKWIDVYNGGVGNKGDVESDALKALIKLGKSERESKSAIAKAVKQGKYNDSAALVKAALKNM